MIIKKTSTKTYDIYDCVKWGMTVRDTISSRERKGLKNSGLDRCFVCGKKFDDDYFPNLALIKGAKNQFICDDCAEAVQKEGEQI